MKSIRHGLRERGGVSFFAFLDVIFSVTGVVIIIALLLALQIDKIRPPTPRADAVAGHSGTISSDFELGDFSASRLRALEAKIAEDREALEASRSSQLSLLDEAEIKAETNLLELRVADLLRQRNRLMATGAPDLPQGDTSPEAVEVARLMFEIERNAQSLRELVLSNEKIVKEMRSREEMVRELESKALAAMSQSRVLRLIPERTDTTKEPIVVEVGEEQVVARRFSGERSLAFLNVEGFSRYCTGFRPAEHYFVLFFRPSGAKYFEDLCDSVRGAGFDLGYDALGEETVLLLGKEEPE